MLCTVVAVLNLAGLQMSFCGKASSILGRFGNIIVDVEFSSSIGPNRSDFLARSHYQTIKACLHVIFGGREKLINKRKLLSLYVMVDGSSYLI